MRPMSLDVPIVAILCLLPCETHFPTDKPYMLTADPSMVDRGQPRAKLPLWSRAMTLRSLLATLQNSNSSSVYPGDLEGAGTRRRRSCKQAAEKENRLRKNINSPQRRNLQGKGKHS